MQRPMVASEPALVVGSVPQVSRSFPQVSGRRTHPQVLVAPKSRTCVPCDRAARALLKGSTTLLGGQTDDG